MSQVDWVGDTPQRRFKDIRNTRDSVAEEKARLVLHLGELCNKVPAHLSGGGSINQVRDWKRTRLESLKVAGNKRASVQELNAAINNMARFVA